MFSDRSEMKKVLVDREGFRISHHDDLLRLARRDLSYRAVIFNGFQYSTFEQRVEELVVASTDEA